MARKRFPRGHTALVKEGFNYLATGKCRERECRAPILWYRTPGGRRIPIDVEKKVPHPWCCPAVKKEKRAIPESKQMEMFPW